jgi:phosphinothricin acetyltransferase
MLSIRLATADDLDAINAIYNHYVATSTTTYDEEPMTADERRTWFAARDPVHPVTVAERNGEIVGYGSLHTFRAKRGYRFVVENSVYVRDDCQRQGVGSAILADLIERARTVGHHAIVAGIDADQHASIALHAKHGFVHVGRMPQIGTKFGRWLDVVFMEKLLE